MNFQIIFLTSAIFVFGAIIGSFLNVVILRLPREKKLSGRSQCPNCHYTLGFFDLVPVFSYLFLGAKCRSCAEPISSRYAAIEIITGLLFSLVFITLIPVSLFEWVSFIRVLIITAALLCIFIIDLEHFLILDKILIYIGLIVFSINIFLDIRSLTPIISLSSLTLGGLVSGSIVSGIFYSLWKISNGKWIGFGDVKLMLFLGIALGFSGLWIGLFSASIISGIVAIYLLAFKGKTMQSKVPFGTFLSLGAFISLLYGHSLLNWYLHLVGF